MSHSHGYNGEWKAPPTDIPTSNHPASQEDDNEEKIESTATNTGQYKNNRSSLVGIVWESH